MKKKKKAAPLSPPARSCPPRPLPCPVPTPCSPPAGASLGLSLPGLLAPHGVCRPRQGMFTRWAHPQVAGLGWESPPVPVGQPESVGWRGVAGRGAGLSVVGHRGEPQSQSPFQNPLLLLTPLLTRGADTLTDTALRPAEPCLHHLHNVVAPQHCIHLHRCFSGSLLALHPTA